jgi:transposase
MPTQTTQSLQALTELLDLEEFEVVEASVERDAKGRKLRRLTVIPRVEAGLCPHCGTVCGERHQCRDYTVSDLPLGAWATELIVRLDQFRCEACDKFFTPSFGALAPGVHVTERLLERAADLVARGDLTSAATFFGLAPKTLEGWYYPYLQRRPQANTRQLQPVKSLGIDELSLKKGAGSSAAS